MVTISRVETDRECWTTVCAFDEPNPRTQDFIGKLTMSQPPNAVHFAGSYADSSNEFDLNSSQRIPVNARTLIGVSNSATSASCGDTVPLTKFVSTEAADLTTATQLASACSSISSCSTGPPDFPVNTDQYGFRLKDSVPPTSGCDKYPYVVFQDQRQQPSDSVCSTTNAASDITTIPPLLKRKGTLQEAIEENKDFTLQQVASCGVAPTDLCENLPSLRPLRTTIHSEAASFNSTRKVFPPTGATQISSMQTATESIPIHSPYDLFRSSRMFPSQGTSQITYSAEPPRSSMSMKQESMYSTSFPSPTAKKDTDFLSGKISPLLHSACRNSFSNDRIVPYYDTEMSNPDSHTTQQSEYSFDTPAVTSQQLDDFTDQVSNVHFNTSSSLPLGHEVRPGVTYSIATNNYPTTLKDADTNSPLRQNSTTYVKKLLRNHLSEPMHTVPKLSCRTTGAGGQSLHMQSLLPTTIDGGGIGTVSMLPNAGKPDESYKDNQLATVNTDAHICSICNRTFKNKQRLTYHKDTHDEKKSFMCNYAGCERAFRSAKYLRNHLEDNHSERKQYSCPLEDCKFVGTRRSHLNSHMNKIHQGLRVFQCTVPDCIRGFRSEDALNTHLRWHRFKRRTFACELCPFMSTSKTERDSHHKVHSRPQLSESTTVPPYSLEETCPSISNHRRYAVCQTPERADVYSFLDKCSEQTTPASTDFAHTDSRCRYSPELGVRYEQQISDIVSDFLLSNASADSLYNTAPLTREEINFVERQLCFIEREHITPHPLSQFGMDYSKSPESTFTCRPIAAAGTNYVSPIASVPYPFYEPDVHGNPPSYTTYSDGYSSNRLSDVHPVTPADVESSTPHTEENSMPAAELQSKAETDEILADIHEVISRDLREMETVNISSQPCQITEPVKAVNSAVHYTLEPADLKDEEANMITISSEVSHTGLSCSSSTTDSGHASMGSASASTPISEFPQTMDQCTNFKPTTTPGTPHSGLLNGSQIFTSPAPNITISNCSPIQGLAGMLNSKHPAVDIHEDSTKSYVQAAAASHLLQPDAYQTDEPRGIPENFYCRTEEPISYQSSNVPDFTARPNTLDAYFEPDCSTYAHNASSYQWSPTRSSERDYVTVMSESLPYTGIGQARVWRTSRKIPLSQQDSRHLSTVGRGPETGTFYPVANDFASGHYTSADMSTVYHPAMRPNVKFNHLSRYYQPGQLPEGRSMPRSLLNNLSDTLPLGAPSQINVAGQGYYQDTAVSGRQQTPYAYQHFDRHHPPEPYFPTGDTTIGLEMQQAPPVQQNNYSEVVHPIDPFIIDTHASCRRPLKPTNWRGRNSSQQVSASLSPCDRTRGGRGPQLLPYPPPLGPYANESTLPTGQLFEQSALPECSTGFTGHLSGAYDRCYTGSQECYRDNRSDSDVVGSLGYSHTGPTMNTYALSQYNASSAGYSNEEQGRLANYSYGNYSSQGCLPNNIRQVDAIPPPYSHNASFTSSPAYSDMSDVRNQMFPVPTQDELLGQSQFHPQMICPRQVQPDQGSRVNSTSPRTSYQDNYRSVCHSFNTTSS